MVMLYPIFSSSYQFLACAAKNLLIFNLGLTLAFATVAIPALRRYETIINHNEYLHFTPYEASWLGNSLNVYMFNI